VKLIANSIQNTGNYTWNIPSGVEAGKQYIIEIMVGSASKVANAGLDTYNYSPVFTIVENVSSTTTSATLSNSATSQIPTTSGYQSYEIY
jgi:hypothetical protein